MKFDFESIKAWFSDRFNRYRIIIIAIALLALLGLVLFTFDRCGGYFSNRQIDKIKANVNAATEDLKAVQANIQKEKQAEAAALERVKIETNTYLGAVNASDAARAETNRAIQNMQSAINGNRPVNITADELDRRLRELGY